MAQIQHRPVPPRDRDDPNPGGVPPRTGSGTQAQGQAIDALLDQIESVLEVNAEEFVRSFVQKGGQ